MLLFKESYSSPSMKTQNLNFTSSSPKNYSKLKSLMRKRHSCECHKAGRWGVNHDGSMGISRGAVGTVVGEFLNNGEQDQGRATDPK